MAQHLVQLQDSAKAAGITGWKSKLRSSEEQAELDAHFAEIRIGEAMTVRIVCVCVCVCVCACVCV